MTKDQWVWMPHNAHLIIGHQCRFHLATYVGKYIVSTVGEWWPDRRAREIHAHVYDKEWLGQNQNLLGDTFDLAYFKRFGFEEIGSGRTYESMVFKARPSTRTDDNYQCCPWEIIVSESVDFNGYNNATEAYRGHLKLCAKWSRKK